MNFFKKIFSSNRDASEITVSKKPEPLSYEAFWAWFQQHEQEFFVAVKERNAIEKEFFDPLSAKLAEIKEGFFSWRAWPMTTPRS